MTKIAIKHYFLGTNPDSGGGAVKVGTEAEVCCPEFELPAPTMILPAELDDMGNVLLITEAIWPDCGYGVCCW